MNITFTFERETKNTVRFQEDVAEDGQPVVGTLYVRKEALHAITGTDEPQRLVVTITKA